jgi:hypothetical protein
MQKRILREINLAEWLTAMGIAGGFIAFGVPQVYGNHTAAGWTLIASGIMAFVASGIAYTGHLLVVAQDERGPAPPDSKTEDALRGSNTSLTADLARRDADLKRSATDIAAL